VLKPEREASRISATRWGFLGDLYRRARGSVLVRDAAETLGTRILLTALGLVSSIVVARTLGPDGRGAFAVAGAVAAIGMQFGNLGLHASNTYYAARDRALLAPLLANALAVSLLGGSCGAGLAWVTLTLWPRLAPVGGSLLVLSLASIPVGLAYMLLQNLLLGLGQVRAYNLLEIAGRLMGLALVALALGLQATSVEALFATGLLASFGSLCLAFWRLRSGIAAHLTPSLAVFRQTIGYGLKSYLTSFFMFMVLRSDLLMVKYMLGTQAAGYYSIAAGMADMVYMSALVVNTVIFPHFAAIKEPEAKWDLLKRTLAVMAALMLALCVPAAALSKFLTGLLFGAAFVPAAVPFIWLLPGIYLLALSGILGSYVASIDIPLSTVPFSCGIMVLNVILNVALIGHFGITGSAIASSICYGLLIPFNLYYARRFREQSRTARLRKGSV